MKLSATFTQQARHLRTVRQTSTFGLRLSAPSSHTALGIELVYTPDILHRMLPNLPMRCLAHAPDSLLPEVEPLREAYPQAVLRYLILPPGMCRSDFAHELEALAASGVFVVSNTPEVISDLVDAVVSDLGDREV